MNKALLVDSIAVTNAPDPVVAMGEQHLGEIIRHRECRVPRSALLNDVLDRVDIKRLNCHRAFFDPERCAFDPPMTLFTDLAIVRVVRSYKFCRKKAEYSHLARNLLEKSLEPADLRDALSFVGKVNVTDFPSHTRFAFTGCQPSSFIEVRGELLLPVLHTTNAHTWVVGLEDPEVALREKTWLVCRPLN